MEDERAKLQKTIAELEKEIAALKKEKRRLEGYILPEDLLNDVKSNGFDLSTLGLKLLKRS